MEDEVAIIDQRPTTNDQRPTTNDQRPTTNDQRPTTNDPMHVALAVYDPSGTYSQHAGVTITSIFETTKSKVIVHVLHDNTLTKENRTKFIRTAEKYSQTIELIDVREHVKRISEENAKSTEIWTIGALYRLFLPDLMPNVNKVIYLDCDIVVNLDIKELWDIDVENYCIAGVHTGFDMFREKVRDWLNGCDNKMYINSGVMIMNLDMLRQHGNIFNDSMAWIEKHVHLMNFSDQDVINGLFHDSMKLIDRKFNNCNPQTEAALQDSIIHTPARNDAVKTWGMAKQPPQKLYWKYYLRSAWGENKTPDELIDVLYNASASTKHSYWQCLHRVIAAPFRRLFIHNATAYILKDMYFKVKYKLTH